MKSTSATHLGTTAICSHRPVVTRLHASSRPCILFTTDEGIESEGVHLLAREVQQRLACEAVVVAPSTPTKHSACRYSYNQQLPLQHRPDLASNAWSLLGSSPADCILCAADQKQGLLQHLQLDPVLTVVGITRGPALSSYVDFHPAVSAARQSAILGLPTVVACTASTTASAPLQPAVNAAGQVLQQVVKVLQGCRGWPRATNYPRAHFPFPTRGRWALGREVAVPARVRAAAAGLGELAAVDCWALGEESSWIGGATGGVSSITDAAEAQRLLQQAFAEGDTLLCINVPPQWSPQTATKPFASTRVGVLWNCTQVTAQGSSSNNSRTSSNVSWRATDQDLYGRSLPSQGFGNEQPVSGAFVGQDNTDKVAQSTATAYNSQESSAAGAFLKACETSTSACYDLPASFTIQPGTVLSDSAVQGDVEAVFSGRVSVCTLQTWPDTHPFHLNDQLLVHALAEDEIGLPAWLDV